ncbi:MAG: 4'-phosphopantetheinyl transferase superfamily protein [Candidatus Babeliales bacterium]|jgi:phosphopantetheine--protein transferase-like protein
MVLGIGVDIVQVSRFKFWVNYPAQQLAHVFSQPEIEYIFSGSQELTMQRMASRFAAKEAFYKALSNTLTRFKKTEETISFLSSCKAVWVMSGPWEVPQLVVDWSFFEKRLAIKLPDLDTNLSISHEKDYAVAYVIIQLGSLNA